MGNNGRQGWKAPRSTCPKCGKNVACSAAESVLGSSLRPHNDPATNTRCSGRWDYGRQR